MTVQTAADPNSERLDAGWISDLIVRWKVADEYIADLVSPGAPRAEEAMKRLIHQDIPILLRELIRLRPELA